MDNLKRKAAAVWASFLDAKWYAATGVALGWLIGEGLAALFK